MELHCYEYTWNELVVKTWNYQMLVPLLLVSCNWNDMVINTLQIKQIRVIFYWVSEKKSRYYQYWIFAFYVHVALHLADDDIKPNLLVVIIISNTLIAFHFFAFLLTSILRFYQCRQFLAFVILNVVVFVWNPDSHLWDLLIAVYLINNFLDKI